VHALCLHRISSWSLCIRSVPHSTCAVFASSSVVARFFAHATCLQRLSSWSICIGSVSHNTCDLFALSSVVARFITVHATCLRRLSCNRKTPEEGYQNSGSPWSLCIRSDPHSTCDLSASSSVVARFFIVHATCLHRLSSWSICIGSVPHSTCDVLASSSVVARFFTVHVTCLRRLRSWSHCIRSVHHSACDVFASSFVAATDLFVGSAPHSTCVPLARFLIAHVT
jgi:hypothetical protein